MIIVKSWSKEEFKQELESLIYREFEILSDKKIQVLEVEFNDEVMKNIDIFFNSLLKFENLKHIFFIKSKTEENDIVCFSIAKKYFRLFFGDLYLKYKITFSGFSEKFIATEIIDERNYFIYCSMNNLKVKWQSGMIDKEKNLIKKYSHLTKYEPFNYLTSIFENFPVSSFNFPTENGVDRFVYYYYVYDEDTKQELIKIMKELNFDLKYLNYVQSANLNVPVSYYALGFSYKNECLIRKTFYFAFFDPFNLEKIREYFQKILNMNISNFKVDSILYAGIDIYESHTELKIYEEGSLFKNNLLDKDLENILNHKFANHVLKIKNGEIIAEKFEFEIKKYFNEKEREILRRKKLIEDTPKVLALYIRDKIIIKSVFYDL